MMFEKEQNYYVRIIIIMQREKVDRNKYLQLKKKKKTDEKDKRAPDGRGSSPSLIKWTELGYVPRRRELLHSDSEHCCLADHKISLAQMLKSIFNMR